MLLRKRNHCNRQIHYTASTPQLWHDTSCMLFWISGNADGCAIQCTETLAMPPLHMLMPSSCNFQGGNFKDVMQQLLPAEHASSEAAPKQPSSDPHRTPKASTGGVQGGKQQAQRASSTAKASTPKRQDEVTTKPAGAKSNDKEKEKDRQDRDRSHSARRDAARSQPVTVLCRTCSWKALQILYCLKVSEDRSE